MNRFVIDPRIWILPPYERCPSCGRDESFGVLMIGGASMVRRCRECWYDQRFELPTVVKTVMYLDQMAISNITKVLHPRVGAGREVDVFWREVFERIDLLCKLQVLVCPDSQSHREESALVPYASALKRIYELFSHGCTFDFGTAVLERQIIEFLQNWLAREPARELDLSRKTVIHGELHGWQERFTFSFASLSETRWADELRAARERGAEGMAAIHHRWRQAQAFDFDAVYRRELRSFGIGTLQMQARWAQRQADVLLGQEPLDLDALLPSGSASLVTSIHHCLREAGVSEAELWERTAEFLTAEDLDLVPSLRISCLLFTALARKAWAGQVRPPNRGTLSDVKTLATVLPYCDAIFVDNEMAGLLAEEPLRTRIGFDTKVFCPNRRDEFLAYLQTLRDAVPDDHVQLVTEVYGADWLRPFTAVFQGT